MKQNFIYQSVGAFIIDSLFTSKHILSIRCCYILPAWYMCTEI